MDKIVPDSTLGSAIENPPADRDTVRRLLGSGKRQESLHFLLCTVLPGGATTTGPHATPPPSYLSKLAAGGGGAVGVGVVAGGGGYW